MLTMKRQEHNLVQKEIEINERHISEFVLETSTGTKRMKEKFHKNAVIDRNNYIKRELQKFKTYQNSIYRELNSYVESKLPQDKTEYYQQEQRNLDQLLSVIPYTEKIISLELKLGLSHILYKINEDKETSLKEINEALIEFLTKFEEASILLTIKDFDYSMFTYQYMDLFFKNRQAENFDELMLMSFKEIYWECPELVSHIKLNLLAIVTKYYKELTKYSIEKEAHLLQENQVTKETIITTYQDKRKKLEQAKEIDEYYNIQKFLSKLKNIDDYSITSPLRTKSFNHFVMENTYSNLTPERKIEFDEESLHLHKHLHELKEYYQYVPIVKDMIDKYKKQEQTKGTYEAKLTEIQLEEKKRQKLYNDFQKASGIGFLAKKSEAKMETLKVAMKNQIIKLKQLYEDLHTLEINVKIASYMTEGSSIHDALIVSLSSYHYIEKIMIEKYKEIDSNFDLEKYMRNYIAFIYNPNTDFLDKITAILDYDISEVISEKYCLLDMNVSAEELTEDNIDTTLEVIDVVALINNIKQSNLSLEEMSLICHINRIDYKLPEEIL